MSSEDQARGLEKALLERADRLAQEQLSNAQRTREQILEQAREHLRLKEEREVRRVKDQAEKTIRQRVQTAEMKMQGEIDLLRWSLVLSVVDKVKKQFALLTEDESTYFPTLQRFLGEAAQALNEDEMTACLNERDFGRLKAQWEPFCREAVPNRQVNLSSEPYVTVGGILVQSGDGRIRVNNTFEARLERLETEVYQTIIERLFKSTSNKETLNRG